MADVKFMTRNGLKSAKKAARREIEGFMELVFFSDDVLKRYESNKDYSVGSNGTVFFGNKWGLFRGVHRAAKGYIGVFLGDLGEGLPEKELRHWKIYNVNPDKVPHDKHYSDFRSSIDRMIYFMNAINGVTEQHLDKIYFDITLEDKRIFDLERVESELNTLKKTINDKTTRDEFQARIIFLNIFLIESINTQLITKFFNSIDENWRYSIEKLELQEILEKYLARHTPDNFRVALSQEIEPLKSLELLKRFLLLLQLDCDIIRRYKIKNLKSLKANKRKIYRRISKEFKKYYSFRAYNTPFPNQKYFVQYEKNNSDNTAFLKRLNWFRSSSAAHGFNHRKYEELLRRLDVDVESDDYAMVYEQLISKLTRDIEHVYYSIARSPPIFEYYKGYSDECLAQLSGEGRYGSNFEELSSYLYDFPSLFPHIKAGLLGIYPKKQNDVNYILALGDFVEYASHSVKDHSQSLVDFVIAGYPYDKQTSIAHISHIVKNSKKLSPSFFAKIDKLIEKALSEDKNDANVDFVVQHLIWCLVQKFPEKLDRTKLKRLLGGRKINWKELTLYLEGE